MKIGLTTACFNGLETEDALKRISETGAETAEIYLKTFYEYRPEFAKKYADNKGGAEICAVHVNPQNFEPQLFSPSRRVRGDGLYWLDQVMRSAQLFGAKYFTFHGFARTGEKLDYDALSGYINGVIDFCGYYGVGVCLENVSFGLYNCPPVFKELKARCPALSGVLDVKQALRAKSKISEYIKDMSGSISYVHLSDVDKKGNLCLPGEGVCDFKELFKLLKDDGFEGRVLIDVPSDKIDKVNKSFNTIKQLVHNI